MYSICFLVSSKSEGDDGEDMDISIQFDEPPLDNCDLKAVEHYSETKTPKHMKMPVLVKVPITDSGSTSETGACTRSGMRKWKSVLLKVPSTLITVRNRGLSSN